jgi:hypothetical protein
MCVGGLLVRLMRDPGLKGETWGTRRWWDHVDGNLLRVRSEQGCFRIPTLPKCGRMGHPAVGRKIAGNADPSPSHGSGSG